MIRHTGCLHYCLRHVCVRRTAIVSATLATHHPALSCFSPFVRDRLQADAAYSAMASSCRLQSTHAGNASRTAATETGPGMIHNKDANSSTLSLEEVWALWNEGNLFSLSVAQMQQFLQSAGIQTAQGANKAALVRRVEEYLHAKESSTSSDTPSLPPQLQRGGGYGPPCENTAVPPETLLDLAQSGFYEGTANMAPKAFQLLTEGTSTDMVVSRVNTSTFPAFPANTECYTLTPTDPNTALRSRFSKVFQWCLLNMCNLQMDGELSVSLGKLLLDSRAMQRGEAVVSTYTMQQRLQLNKLYTWVTAIPESAITTVETFLKDQGFFPVGEERRKETPPPLSYEVIIKRAKDKLHADLDATGRLSALHNEWVDIQTVHHTRPRGPDVRLLLRSRPPISRTVIETYQSFPIIELSNDDVNDVLPPEHGQIIYLSENETRRFERVNDRGIVITVLEIKRQPLIVLRDDEEDPRIEYTISVVIPASAGGRTMDVRAVGLEIFELATSLAAAVETPFAEAYGCTAA
ncbi:unnamed protein product [Phytomonas sp. EM1]|nr:unnamed protein product [Phytomonas sp. EM1]|eukprot:CCW65558.1 unnamed protein product [Phytomonas sp. isolate EM1]